MWAGQYVRQTWGVTVTRSTECGGQLQAESSGARAWGGGLLPHQGWNVGRENCGHFKKVKRRQLSKQRSIAASFISDVSLSYSSKLAGHQSKEHRLYKMIPTQRRLSCDDAPANFTVSAVIIVLSTRIHPSRGCSTSFTSDYTPSGSGSLSTPSTGITYPNVPCHTARN